MQPSTYRRWALAGVLALVFAFAYLVQPSGDNEKANYALTRALADGTPRLDDELRGPGALATIDIVRYRGHDYAAKAPGLALFSVPAFLALEAVGVDTRASDPIRPLWALHLWASVLPGAVLLLLVLRLGDRVERGSGLAAAVVLGLSTLVLPFATLFFVHVLSACFGFAAFALLWHERDGRPRAWLAAGAGLLAGLAVTTDYPLALLALVLGVYAVSRPGAAIRTGAAYTGGFALGAAPVFLYNLWAFGSLTHFPYEGWRSPDGDEIPGFFGATAPSLRVALTLLFLPAGIAVLAPAVVGLVVLWRRGRRAGSLAIAAVAGLYLLHNASSVANPFGGASPGPRHLIVTMPFLAVALAVAFRALPGPTIALAAGGAAVMAVYTATTPLAAWDRRALNRFADGDFVPSVGSLAGVDRWVGVVPFLLALAVAAAALVATQRASLTRRELAIGAVALLGWVVLVRAGQSLLFDGARFGSALVVALAATVVATVAALYRLAPPRRPAAGFAARASGERPTAG